MESYLLDWANLLLRWLHVIAAIAWVGSSFYFVWLDNHLVKPTSPDLLEKGVDGALWAVHGGGFYNPQKYMVAPRKIHTTLHWFYWESYTTWLSGFALFVVLYLWQADSFLVDARVFAWSPMAAGVTAVALLAVFWLVYDAACRLLGPRGERWVLMAIVAAIVLASWGVCQLYPGRAAYLLVGAMIATAMSANVFFVIIPGQKKAVAAMLAGQPVDPRLGQRAKQRSVHNTYFTLPVVVAMLSNHYPMVTQHRWNWLLLVLLLALGAVVRLFFVKKHKAPPPWPLVGVAALLVAALVWLARPEPGMAATSSGASPAALSAAPVSFRQVQAIVEQRCVACHNAALANKAIALHTPELIERHAQAIHQQTVVLKAMPMNNVTGITAAERALLARWFSAGARTHP
jgi:uncharacterized membrane protein